MQIFSIDFNKKSPISFKGGLTRAIKSEILTTDCSKVENFLMSSKNISADFAGNKLIAWSTYNIVKILTEIESRFGFKTYFPTNIFTANLKDYNIENSDLVYGFSNFLPCKFKKNSQDLVPGMSIIFNKNFPWEKIDDISDSDFSKGCTTTNYFLESFFHEFAHIMHEGNLIKRSRVKDLPNKFNLILDGNNIQKYRSLYGKDVKKALCDYALESPLDLIACDISYRIIKSIDKNNLGILENPFKASPYSTNYIKTFFSQKKDLDTFISKIFHGETKFFDKIL